jgi:preprotein translocase subunit YajC
MISTILSFILPLFSKALKSLKTVNVKVVMLVIIVLLGILLWFIWHYYSEQKAEAQRYAENVTALKTGIGTYIAKNGQLVSTVNKQAITINDLKSNYGNIVKEAENLKLDVKRLTLAMSGTSSTQIIIHDTIPVKDTTFNGIKSKCFTHSEKWYYSMGACISDSIVKGKTVVVPGSANVSVNDSITILGQRIPKHHFLWWKWGTKAIRLNSTNKNPYNKFVINEYLELAK